MPKITKKIGTGMTERGLVRFDAEDPGDIHDLIEAGVNTLDRSSFHRLSRRLGDLARGILDKARLPSDPEPVYLVGRDAAWLARDPGAVMDHAEYLPLNLAVQECGYQPDSAEGYAAGLLMILMRARHCLDAGSIDDAMAQAFAAGELATEASMKDLFETDFVTGARVRAGGRKAHAATYGTAEEKAARSANYLAAFDAVRAKGIPKMKAYKTVARQFGVSEITVRRPVAERRRKRTD